MDRDGLGLTVIFLMNMARNDSGLLVNITRDDLGFTVGHFAKPESTAINPVHDQMMLCQKKKIAILDSTQNPAESRQTLKS